MLFTLNPANSQPLYLQLMQQIRHGIETGVLQEGDGLPGVRTLAQELVVSPNTVVKAYTQLAQEGFLILRHGSGAYVAELGKARQKPNRVRQAQERVRTVVKRLQSDGFSDEEIQRLVEAELFYQVPVGKR